MAQLATTTTLVTSEKDVSVEENQPLCDVQLAISAEHEHHEQCRETAHKKFMQWERNGNFPSSIKLILSIVIPNR